MAKNKASASVALRVLKLLKKYIPLLILSIFLAMPAMAAEVFDGRSSNFFSS